MAIEITNIRHHRIRWRLLLAQGALAGLLSAVVMALIASLLYPLVASDADAWSFPKLVSSVFLGNGAADPIAGFEATPVLVGLVTHLGLGVLAGAVYAVLVAMFDLEGWTPVTLFGLLFGAMLFVWSAALIGAGLTPESTRDFPIIVMFWANIAFGLSAGMFLATWADRADLDQADDERVGRFEGDDDVRPRPVIH